MDDKKCVQICEPSGVDKRRHEFSTESAKRKQSMAFLPGKEGNFVAKGCNAGKAIAVFTSGGDAQGESMLQWYKIRI